MGRVTGHVYRVPRARDDQWYVKFRLASGKQVQQRLGPAWDGPGRPPDGHFTERTATDRLQDTLAAARRGGMGSRPRSGRTFGDACEEWLRYVEFERERAPATLRDYRNVVKTHLRPQFGDTPIEEVTTDAIDAFREQLLEGDLGRRTAQKILVLLHGILERAKRRKWIATNPAADAERVTIQRSGDFNVLTPAQVFAVSREAASEQDAAVILVAAFTGLRVGELRALRWGDVDFAGQSIIVRTNYSDAARKPKAPKSGRVRSVPLIEQAIVELDRLSRRDELTEPGDLVFPSPSGRHLDDGALRRRFYAALEQAGLGHLRTKPDPIVFHDLRHTFGTLGAAVWPLHELQGYMGHASIQTTMIYVHHVPKLAAAAQLSNAVAASLGAPEATVSRTVSRT